MTRSPNESGTSIRAAASEDWPAIWPFMRRILAAGETFSWERDVTEAQARRKWFMRNYPAVLS
jgi:hypothetical protein